MPIESKADIKEAIDYMVKQDIFESQIEPTPWVSSLTYPVKPTGEVRPCLDVRDINKAIIRENHEPQTMEEIVHQLAGAVVFTKADTQGFSTGTPHRSKQQTTSNQQTQGKVTVQVDAIWSQNVPGCLTDEDGPHHGKVPRSNQQ